MKTTVKVYDVNGEVGIETLVESPNIERKFVVYFPTDDHMVVAIGPEYCYESPRGEKDYYHVKLAGMAGVREEVIIRSCMRRVENGERIEGGGMVTVIEEKSELQKSGVFRTVRFFGQSGDFHMPSHWLCSNDAIRSILEQTEVDTMEVELSLNAFISTHDGDLLF